MLTSVTSDNADKNLFRNRLKRSPEADFVSTYMRKHGEMREIWKKFRTKFENQTEADLIDEMNTFLSSTKEVEDFFKNQRSLKPSKVNLYRPQLGSFGTFKQSQFMTNGLGAMTRSENSNGTENYENQKWTKDDPNLNPVLSPWFDEIENDFNLVLIQEYFFMSLALMVETLCWAVEDVIIEPTISWLDSIQPDAYQNKLSVSSIRKVSRRFSIPWH